MANYSGQETGSMGFSPYDGERMFTEYHRKRAHLALESSAVNTEFMAELRLLSAQDPFPSVQATFWLKHLSSLGSSAEE